jgi:dienelactone hydrolase
MPDITYPAPTDALPGYLAVPNGLGPWPGVVVIHDALGLSADIRRITDRFAEAGYLALAPRCSGGGSGHGVWSARCARYPAVAVSLSTTSSRHASA